MRLVIISDTHGMHRALDLPTGDVLLHAGDVTSKGKEHELQEFNDWLGELPFKHKVVVGGNHDFTFEKFDSNKYHPYIARDKRAKLTSNFTYLCDSGCTIDGVNFWGSPYQPRYYDWAFNLPRNGIELERVWAKVPADTHVLLTHTPPYGILDATKNEDHAGCERLTARLPALTQLKVHCFGHLHESYGVADDRPTGPVFVNASNVNLQYKLVNAPVVVDI
jgi:predicted phosphohydrolase